MRVIELGLGLSEAYNPKLNPDRCTVQFLKPLKVDQSSKGQAWRPGVARDARLGPEGTSPEQQNAVGVRDRRFSEPEPDY